VYLAVGAAIGCLPLFSIFPISVSQLRFEPIGIGLALGIGIGLAMYFYQRSHDVVKKHAA
jgi:hypothetical protein